MSSKTHRDQEQFKQAAETERTLITAGVNDGNENTAGEMFKRNHDLLKRQFEARKLNLGERQQRHKEIMDAENLKLKREKQDTDRYIARINKN